MCCAGIAYSLPVHQPTAQVPEFNGSIPCTHDGSEVLRSLLDACSLSILCHHISIAICNCFPFLLRVLRVVPVSFRNGCLNLICWIVSHCSPRISGVTFCLMAVMLVRHYVCFLLYSLPCIFGEIFSLALPTFLQSFHGVESMSFCSLLWLLRLTFAMFSLHLSYASAIFTKLTSNTGMCIKLRPPLM